MSNWAGFAVVAEVRQTAVNQTLRIYHAADLVPNPVTDSSSFPNPIGSGQATVGWGLFLDAPQVVFSSGFGDYIALNLRLHGTITVTVPNQGTATRTSVATTTILVRPALDVVAGGVVVRPRLDDVVINSLALTVINGPPFPASAVTIVTSPAALAALTQLVRANLGQINSLAPPLLAPTIVQFGFGNMVELKRLTYRVLDGALAVAIDVNPKGVQLSTSGSTSQIVDFLGVGDIAVCVNPAMLAVIQRAIKPQIQAALDDANTGVVLDDLLIVPMPDHLLIAGHATKDIFGAGFSFRVKPKLGTPGGTESWVDEYGTYHEYSWPGSSDLWIDVWDVQLDEELPWYIWLGIIAGSFILAPAAPVVGLAVSSIIESIRNNIIHQIEHHAESAVGESATQRITLPGTSGPDVDFVLREVQASELGLQTRVEFNPRGHAGIEGPFSMDVADIAFLPPVYRLHDATLRWHPQDPLVRVTWQVRRLDTNEVVLQRTSQLTDANARVIGFFLGVPPLNQVDEFSIQCRVVRTLGGPAEQLLNVTMKLRIGDSLDRSRPYVHWSHSVWVPQVVVHPDGTHEKKGWDVEHRQSAVHRTAVPGRCQFAARFGVRKSDLKYLDQLPFGPEALEARRDELCEYCFYGGPDKDGLTFDPWA